MARIDLTTLRDTRMSVLCLLMLDEKHRGEALELLSDKLFDDTVTRPVYQAIRTLHFEGAPVDPITIIDRLGEAFRPVIESVLDTGGCGDLLYYCGILRRDAQKAAIQQTAVALSVADDETEQNRLLDELNGLMVAERSKRIVTAAEAADAFFTSIKRREKPEYLTFGIPALDRSLRVEPGDFVVIGGYASSGKTLLSLQLLRTLATCHRVGFFSLETNAGKLTDRTIAAMSGIPLGRIKDRDLNEADCAAIGTAASDLSGLTFDFIEASSMSVPDIRATALNRRYDVIFVDYLQIVEQRGNSQYEEVTKISKGLHQMAQKNKITVIALAQLNRADKPGRDGKRQPPGLSSLRESGQIEQDADVVMLLWPENYNDNRSRRVLKIAKNKEGEHDRILLDFDGATQTFTPAKPTWSETAAAIKRAGRDDAKAQQEREAAEEAAAKAAQTSFPIIEGDDKDMPF